jgi:hypothetical protein
MIAVVDWLLDTSVGVGAEALLSILDAEILVVGAIRSTLLDGHVRAVEVSTLEHAVAHRISATVKEGEVADILVSGGKCRLVDVDAIASSAEDGGISSTCGGALRVINKLTSERATAKALATEFDTKVFVVGAVGSANLGRHGIVSGIGRRQDTARRRVRSTADMLIVCHLGNDGIDEVGVEIDVQVVSLSAELVGGASAALGAFAFGGKGCSGDGLSAETLPSPFRAEIFVTGAKVGAKGCRHVVGAGALGLEGAALPRRRLAPATEGSVADIDAATADDEDIERRGDGISAGYQGRKQR